jgi:hypothetical protein
LWGTGVEEAGVSVGQVFSHSLYFVIVLSHFVFSSVILWFSQSFYDFLSHFMRHRGGGGRGIGGRGAGCRRTQRSLTGEVRGGGGRSAHRWRGGVRSSRKRRSSAGEAWDGGCNDVRSGGRGGWHGVDWSGWTLLEKWPWVSAGNPLLISARLTDTIYRIRKVGHFWYRLLPADTNNHYWYWLS